MRLQPDNVARPLFWIAVCWFIAVVAQGLLAGLGWTFIPVDFALSGQFGDSFGFLGAAMAAAAAIGAWQAVADQRAELRETKDREDELRKDAAKRDFESTFFSLLTAFDRIVAQMDVGRLLWQRTGKDAFSLFVEKVYKNRTEGEPDFRNAYTIVFLHHQDDLAHYFRTIFNIVAFVRGSRTDDAYFYIKLVRATLSEPELVMLALNGIYHEEGEKYFKPLIEEFALLNNVSASARADFDLEQAYLPGAFKREADTLDSREESTSGE